MLAFKRADSIRVGDVIVLKDKDSSSEYTGRVIMEPMSDKFGVVRFWLHNGDSVEVVGTHSVRIQK